MFSAAADEVDSKNFLETVFAGLTVSRPTSAKPSSKYTPVFNMSHKRRGVCAIFNQVRFGLELSERTGSEVDAESLKECFERLGFKATIYRDYTCAEIEAEINDSA